MFLQIFSFHFLFRVIMNQGIASRKWKESTFLCKCFMRDAIPYLLSYFSLSFWENPDLNSLLKALRGWHPLVVLLNQEMPSLYWIQVLMLLESSHFTFYFEYL